MPSAPPQEKKTWHTAPDWPHETVKRLLFIVTATLSQIRSNTWILNLQKSREQEAVVDHWLTCRNRRTRSSHSGPVQSERVLFSPVRSVRFSLPNSRCSSESCRIWKIISLSPAGNVSECVRVYVDWEPNISLWPLDRQPSFQIWCELGQNLWRFALHPKIDIEKKWIDLIDMCVQLPLPRVCTLFSLWFAGAHPSIFDSYFFLQSDCLHCGVFFFCWFVIISL